MKNVYKVFIGCFAACILLVVADWGLGSWSEKMYHKSKYGIYHRQLYCLESSNDEILIMGSSRAAHHYVPQIIEDSLGMSCYNAGSDGQCIYYHYTLLASMLERGAKPKIVIYEVLNLDINKSQGATFTIDAALDRLAPHYGEYRAVNDLFEQKDWKEKIKLCSKTYRYNSKLVQTIKCNYMPETEDRGYEELNGKLNYALATNDKAKIAKSNENKLEELKLKYITMFFELCIQHDIKLVMMYSPYYKESSDNAIIQIKDIAVANGVPFFDYCSNQKFQVPELFYDVMHLNDNGARLYTNEIVKYLKQ